jgi:phage-related tail protein
MLNAKSAREARNNAIVNEVRKDAAKVKKAVETFLNNVINRASRNGQTSIRVKEMYKFTPMEKIIIKELLITNGYTYKESWVEDTLTIYW